MPVIAVVGTSGVGKSLLVRQLAAFHCSPAFFEGEVGVFPDWILESVVSGKDPLVRWQWFIDRYAASLARARQASDAGLFAFVEGSALSAEAVSTYEPAELHEALQAHIARLSQTPPDVTVVLTASEEFLRRKIAERGRSAEQNEKVFHRSLAIQDAFARLAHGRSSVVVLDRSSLDFFRYEDLQKISSLLQKSLGTVLPDHVHHVKRPLD